MFTGRDSHDCTAPKSDLQQRLRKISRMCEEIESAHKDTNPDISRLAYWVSYLSDAVEIHLRTNET